MVRIWSILAAAGLLGACGQPGDRGLAAIQSGAPSLETRAPNARNQSPAFAGQTRAPAQPTSTPFDVVAVADGLDHPWSLAFLPNGEMLVTERAGRLRRVGADGALSEPLAGVPQVVAQGQAGLLDVALDPDFPANRRLYLTYMERRSGGNNIAVARAELSAGRLDHVKVIFHAAPARSGTTNNGSRLAFAPDGSLFVSIGDRFSPKMAAQDLSVDSGKIIRITTDGAAPPDNPFVGRQDVRPEIWAYGVRNPEALAINPSTGALWDVEHGARGGDEINVIEAGKNYGWPVITYGIDYSGMRIGEGITQREGMEQPLYYWDPVIAPSGMMFYTGEAFPAWKGSLFVGGLSAEALVRLSMDGRRVTGEERLLGELGERIRDVRQGPDGLIYVLTDSAQGRILKLAPKS